MSRLSGTIKEKRDLKLFLIELEDGRIVRRHVDHIPHCYEESDLSTEDLEEIELPIDLDSESIPDTSPTCPTGPAEEHYHCDDQLEYANHQTDLVPTLI